MWTFEKRGAEMERMTAAAKEKTMEVLKTEVCSVFVLAGRRIRRSFVK